jgi:hypothetical protein
MAQRFLIQAPGGSGKSLTQVVLAQADIEACGNKQLILVPRNHIHHTFWSGEEITFRLPASDHVSHWRVGLNLCLKSDCNRLKQWLLAEPDTDCLVAITTHSAMVFVWKGLSKEEKRRALRRITFRIDEAHHISQVFHEADLELYNVKDRAAILADATALGSIVNYILRVNDSTVKLHLTTATFFRGDKKTILSKAFRRDFVHYELPWDEHFDTLGLSNLEFDFINYDGDLADLVVEAIREEPEEHHLIIIPALTHRYRTRKTLAAIMSKLSKVFPAAEVLDLVTQKTQKAHKALLMKHPEAFKVVVACRLFDEGTDWVPCSRLHNTDAGEDSVTLAVQRFFRPLRMHKDKQEVKIFNYIPTFSPDLELMEQRAILSDRFNAVMACIVTQGELVPILVAVKKPTSEGHGHKRWQDLYGDNYPVILEDLLKGYEQLPEKTGKAVKELAEKVMDEYGCPDEIEKEDVIAALCHQVMRFLPKKSESGRRTLVPTVIGADEIRKQGFDKIWPKDAMDSAIWWGTDKVDGAVIRHLLGIIKPVPSLQEIHDGLRSYFKRTGHYPGGSAWCGELDRSMGSLDYILRRHYGTTLRNESAKLLGGRFDGLVEQTQAVIQEYWERGIKLHNSFGMIPELGISSMALEAKLWRHHGTSIAEERKKILGTRPEAIMPLDKVKDILRMYIERGKRITCDTEDIPELEISGCALDGRLRSWYGVKLPELVTQLAGEMNVVLRRQRLDVETVMPLNTVKDVLREYIGKGKRLMTNAKEIPELGISGPVLRYRLRAWYGIELPRLLADLGEEMDAVTTMKARKGDICIEN